MNLEAKRQYTRLPSTTTLEEMESRWSKVIRFRERVLVTGCRNNGQGEPRYYGAVYEHLDDDFSCKGPIGVKAISDAMFEDEGTALFWAMMYSGD